MAPDWVFNLSITSKVDVYSYGIVALEMVTGMGPSGHKRLVTWVREVMNRVAANTSSLEEIIDPLLEENMTLA